MSLLVQLKSFNDKPVEFRVALDLPSKPTDAAEGNSTWEDKDLGYIRFSKGYCVASKVKAAFPDTLFLYHRTPKDGDPGDSRVPKDTRLIVMTLSEFFGSDGGIREKGTGIVNPKVATTPRLAGIEWSIEQPQRYPKSVSGAPAP